VLLNKTELIRTGKKKLDTDGIAYNLNDIIEYATEHHLENLIAIDNTSSTFVENYIPLVDSSFDLISSNKVANTLWFFL
jgi:aspartokinase/homoserine dehydrogenase 1